MVYFNRGSVESVGVYICNGSACHCLDRFTQRGEDVEPVVRPPVAHGLVIDQRIHYIANIHRAAERPGVRRRAGDLLGRGLLRDRLLRRDLGRLGFRLRDDLHRVLRYFPFRLFRLRRGRGR